MVESNREPITRLTVAQTVALTPDEYKLLKALREHNILWGTLTIRFKDRKAVTLEVTHRQDLE